MNRLRSVSWQSCYLLSMITLRHTSDCLPRILLLIPSGQVDRIFLVMSHERTVTLLHRHNVLYLLSLSSWLLLLISVEGIQVS